MATAEELLNSISKNQVSVLSEDDGIFAIDSESRTITVPDSERLFGVKGDKDVERKYFQCPKIVGDNIDLSQHQIYVSYVFTTTENNTAFPTIGNGLYHCEDVEVSGDNITFSWLLSGNVFANPGFIAFKVMAKKSEGGELKTKWNTAPAIGTVLLTVPDGEEIAEEYPDIINQLLTKMESVEQIATPEAMQEYVNAYLEENPVTGGMTEEQKQQLKQNTQDITDLKSAINEKVNKSGWTPGKYLGTDSDGNIVVKNVPDGSGGDTEPSSQNLIDSTQYTNSGYAGDLFTQFGANTDVFNTEIDTSENKTFYYRVYRSNQVYDHKVGLKVGCYDSSGDWLYTMNDTNGDYTKNFETYIREDGNNSEPLEIVDDQKVVVKIIGMLTIPSEVSKIKIAIPANSPMVKVFYPAFAVSDKPITNFGSITNGDYSLIQGETSGGDEEASSNKPLLNKVLGMIGDSLTNWGGGNDTQDGFLKIIHDRTGISTVNLGLAGATWEEADGQTQPGVTRVDTYVSGAVRYDCIAFLLGTNVANQGEVTDTSDTKTTMCGAIKYCLEQLITLSPTTPIIVFLPPQRAEGNTEQKARNDIIKQICEIYGVYTFDLYTRSQVIPNTTVTGNGTLSDGLHLSKKGQENFGRIMSTAILNVMGYY